jgi:hypothetical protein
VSGDDYWFSYDVKCRLHRLSICHRITACCLHRSSTRHRLLYVSRHVLHLRLHVSPHYRMLNTDLPNVTAPPHVVDTDHPLGTACYTCHRTFCTTYQRVTVSPHYFIRIVVLDVRSTTTKPGFCPTTTRRILVDGSYPEYLMYMRILLPTPRMRSFPQGSHGKWGGGGTMTHTI